MAPTVNSFKNHLDRAWSDAPFRYDYKSETVTTRMRTNTSTEDVTNEQSIGTEA